MCRELTKGQIDAKANLNIIGDEAIIEIEETVPSCNLHKHKHHKSRKHRHHKKDKNDCSCKSEETELKEESSCVKKETALADALAKEAQDAKDRCACQQIKPVDPLKISVDSTKQLSA